MDIAQEEIEKKEFEPEYDLTKEQNLDYLHATAKKGNADSMLRIANLYAAYARDENDYEKAFLWAEKAKEHGNIEAYFLLGEMYQYGVGCERNLYLAKKCYRQLLQTVDLQDHLGHTTIANLYENYAELLQEHKNFKNLYRAKCFYKKAIQWGSKTAEKKMEHLEEHWKEEFSEWKEKGCYALACVIVLVIAFKIIIKNCSEPARHLVDSVIHKALTVKDAETADVRTTDEDKGVTLLTEDDAEYEKYHQVTKADMENGNYVVCDITDAKATSEQVADVGANYGIANTYDGKLYTNWQENEKDAGINQQLTYTFAENKTINGIGIYLGNGRTEKAYTESNRPESITFSMNNKEVVCSFEDTNEMKYIILDEPLQGSEITLTINSVYQGESDKNITAITEIVFYQ